MMNDPGNTHRQESVLEVLRSFGDLKRTGALVLKRPRELAIIYLRDGVVVGRLLPGRATLAEDAQLLARRSPLAGIEDWEYADYHFRPLEPATS